MNIPSRKARPIYPVENRFLDLTLPLSPLVLRYPEDPHPIIKTESHISKGDALTASRFSMNCHVGTHVDAPAHFLRDGATLDELPLERFYGPAVVTELMDRDVISIEDLENAHLPAQRHLLLKTRNSELLQLDIFSQNYCTLSPEAANVLCSLQPLSVGFDYYSLDPYQEEGPFPAHMMLARFGIPAYVCLNLLDVVAGDYVFSGFPLRLAGVEASPVRAVLMKTINQEPS